MPMMSPSFSASGTRSSWNAAPRWGPSHTIAWFAIYGANINIDADGKIVSIVDAKAALDLYRGYCQAMDLDCSKLIVHGE